MASFNWLSFFAANRIEYSDSGANTSRDNVVVRCPFCGSQDQSKHMSVNLSGKGWKCWRSPDHRGINPARLVQMLLGCSFERANQIVGNAVFVPEDFMARVKAELDPPPSVDAPSLKLPPEFKPFSGFPSALPYEAYLLRRGFTLGQVDQMTNRYGVRYCTRGTYHGRIIFPVRYKGKLVSWTGRTIHKREELRYRALSTDPERAAKEGYSPATGAISHYLLWFDMLREADADTIILTEGPFDALRVNILGRRHGIVSTCFFTSAPTVHQVDLLQQLIPRYKKRITLLDAEGTFANGIRIASTLSSLDIITKQLPVGVADPGEFTFSTFNEFLLAIR